uniref:GBF-interacting protein 1 N-terminal domain-containing protein n=1 Tax=Davidia involucrata TaxID=16924 RepID=A0A5B6ZG77_DAVIN
MSSRGGSSNNGGGVQSISAASRKMVQSLKEIVNCPEQEIYAMLKECNMDPNEAVNRLLSQDPFHEVKRKREKKKENKDTTELRSRGVSSSSNHGSRGAADRYAGRGGSTQFSTSESVALHGKPAPKKESGTNSYASFSSSASEMAGNNMNRRPSALSDSVTTENKGSTIGTVDGISSSSQLSSGYQSTWLGVPGQVSMADIVKMGRPHGKASTTPNPSYHSGNHHHVQAPPSTVSHHDFRSSEDHASKVSLMKPEPGVGMGQHVSANDEWPLIEQPPAVSVPSLLEPPADSELHGDPSNLPFDRINQNPHSQADEVRAAEDGAVENPNANHVGSASVSVKKMQEDNSGGASLFDNDLYKNMGSYQPHRHAFEHQEVEDGGPVASVTTNLQQLSIQKEDQGAPPEENNPSVVIPNHLQVQTADCLHLSFGSFGSGISNAAAFSGSFASRPSKSDLEEESADADTSSIGHSDTRNPEYYGDEPLRTVSDGSLAHRTGATGGSFDSPSASQPDVLKQENPEAAPGNQYTFPSSTPGYTFENAQQLNTAFSHSPTSSQMQNLAPFSSVMAYTNSLPSTLLAATVQPMREDDLPYSPFPMTQAMPTKYGNSVSSISGSTISMPEALKTDSFSTTQPTAQTMPGTSVATGPALPQHLAVHPYSQPTLPLGPFANMIGYPFLPQSYTYMPSAFQQAFAGNSIYHQSLAAVLPQYKNSISVSSLPQSAAVASGYGAFGSSTSIPGNFPMNPPAAPAGTTIGYDDLISSQYKDGSHLMSLQQNDNSAMWVHGPSSRTMSAVPTNTYYNFQGQNQQPAGFRQSQQPSQNYGALGYPNFYQTGISLEHQQQNPRDGSLSGGSQGQPSKQSQQIWQNSY